MGTDCSFSSGKTDGAWSWPLTVCSYTFIPPCVIVASKGTTCTHWHVTNRWKRSLQYVSVMQSIRVVTVKYVLCCSSLWRRAVWKVGRGCFRGRWGQLVSPKRWYTLAELRDMKEAKERNAVTRVRYQYVQEVKKKVRNLGSTGWVFDNFWFLFSFLAGDSRLFSPLCNGYRVFPVDYLAPCTTGTGSFQSII